jgi:hypothetical protein
MGVMQSSNPGATRILRVPLAAHEGTALSRSARAGGLWRQRQKTV